MTECRDQEALSQLASASRTSAAAFGPRLGPVNRLPYSSDRLSNDGGASIPGENCGLRASPWFQMWATPRESSKSGGRAETVAETFEEGDVALHPWIKPNKFLNSSLSGRRMAAAQRTGDGAA